MPEALGILRHAAAHAPLEKASKFDEQMAIFAGEK
jgi:hypothetical protein